MDANLQLTIEPLNLPPELAEKLEKLQPGCYCTHRSWGLGKIREWDPVSGQMVIDFDSKSGHGMELEYAAQSLKPLPPEHVEIQVRENLPSVQQMAETDVLGLMQSAVQSLQHEATIDRLEKLLSPSVIPADRWKKWWESAKRAMKKDGHYTVPARRNQPIVFRDAPIDHRSVNLEQFRKTVGAKPQAALLEKLERRWKTGEDLEAAREVVVQANKTLSLTPKSQAAAAIELVLARDEFIQKAGLEKAEENSLEKFISSDPKTLTKILAGLSSFKQSQCLNNARVIFGENWAETFLSILPKANIRAVEAVAGIFKEQNRSPEFLSALDRFIRERNLSVDTLIWLCKNRRGDFQSLLGPQLFSSILAVLELDQLSENNRRTRMQDLLVSDKNLIRDLLAPATDEQVREITRAITWSTAFEELDKRSLLASVVKLYPFVQDIITSEEPTTAVQTQSFIVSWESLQKRQAELEGIINKKIPENSKEIAIARSYGDLSENHEFKAAKEMQTVLMRRRAELEEMLTAATGTDFKDADTSQVSIGTKVNLIDTETGENLAYTILGAWDSDPENGIISYLTATAQALLNRKPSDIVELSLATGGTRKVKIQEIKTVFSD